VPSELEQPLLRIFLKEPESGEISSPMVLRRAVVNEILEVLWRRGAAPARGSGFRAIEISKAIEIPKKISEGSGFLRAPWDLGKLGEVGRNRNNPVSDEVLFDVTKTSPHPTPRESRFRHSLFFFFFFFFKKKMKGKNTHTQNLTSITGGGGPQGFQIILAVSALHSMSASPRAKLLIFSCSFACCVRATLSVTGLICDSGAITWPSVFVFR
jgi:hypothetical protein